MVSADTPKSALMQHEKGYRTFRVKTPEAPVLEGETVCPADTGVTCADCRACSGALAKGSSIVIDVHGSRSSRYTKKFQRANKVIPISTV